MSRTGSKQCGICQSTFGDGDCIHRSGQGTTDDPYIFEPVIDPVAGNMIECSPNGLAAFLEPIYQDPPACHVYSTADHPIAWDTPQGLHFDESRYDTDSMHDKEKNIDRITFNTAGVYLVTLNLRWKKTNDDTATGDLAAFIRKNGSDFIALDSFPITGGDSYAKHSISRIHAFEAGDYVSAIVKQDVVIEGAENPQQNLIVTTERMSPVFSAVFLRSIEDMNILGVPESSSTESGGGGVGTQYTLDGTQWWQTDDHASLDITGDLDIRIAAAAVDWTPAGIQALVSKWSGLAGELAYLFLINLGGALRLGANGAAQDSTANPVVSDGGTLAVRVTLDVDNGAGSHVRTFYTKGTTAANALTDCASDSGWTILGAAVTTGGTITLPNSPAPLAVGAGNVGGTPTNHFNGDIYAMVLKNGINGTTVANPDFYHNNSPFTDGSGRTWIKV